jgi:hypothetical protein
MPQIWFIASQNQELTFTNLTKFLIKNPDKKKIAPLSAVLHIGGPLTFWIFLIAPKQLTNFTSYQEYPNKHEMSELLTRDFKIQIKS